MKWFVITLLFTSFAYSQDYKNDISVVHYTAKFIENNSLELKGRDFNKYVFYLEENKKIFENDNVKFVPTILLFQNGKEILRIEGGVGLKLPEDAIKKTKKKINELIQNKF